ncbi:hypothetical protein EMPG_09664 [Blastomyces silverae]|uniref:Uncharacterized protein n=1 Tax=Blastomyces silverae TaxID=2060906 RepID=A0A0H1BKL3_9EURO|nr:hypothetical protein EMPG_09664 [Blastomyces silverae]
MLISSVGKRKKDGHSKSQLFQQYRQLAVGNLRNPQLRRLLLLPPLSPILAATGDTRKNACCARAVMRDTPTIYCLWLHVRHKSCSGIKPLRPSPTNKSIRLFLTLPSVEKKRTQRTTTATVWVYHSATCNWTF